MKRLLNGIIAAILAIGATVGLSACASQHIDMSQVTAVIDVRSAQEFATGHLEGAVNIDVESSSFASEIGKLDTNGHYVLYCRSGHRAGIALDQMKAAGFNDLINAGGYADASTATGLPIVTN